MVHLELISGGRDVLGDQTGGLTRPQILPAEVGEKDSHSHLRTPPGTSRQPSSLRSGCRH